jgi:hypothetical protein
MVALGVICLLKMSFQPLVPINFLQKKAAGHHSYVGMTNFLQELDWRGPRRSSVILPPASHESVSGTE